MKPRLIIISDLWGIENSDWINTYFEILKTRFEIQLYDSCKLANISLADRTENKLHDEFINGGIDFAVESLLHLEKGNIAILAFSIGGTLAWKAGLKGLKISNFSAISSTRLRYETTKPNCKIKLYFGEHDQNRPLAIWAENLNIDSQILKNEGHEMYKKHDFTIKVCGELISNLKF
ncbi:alpha/beta hydrolase [Flavobacterium soyangense]|uniref:Alpha/beta hydrolase n=1 Tax=Flavobacterium soyangense TaxID=2023265 RepID=A0A930UEQ0_9FLAO|nr:alpha/beta hydrolase [Flavobacterium soyangense]MBF2709931.1 alpha/beta hydrolase [Flavobacterium soyangense]